MEFSDQDNFSSLEGPHEFRVKPPPGFKEDLGLLGSKFENQGQQQQPQLQLQSSIDQASQINPFANLLGGLGGLGQLNNQQTSSISTPNLPNQFSPSFNPLAGLSQEQLQQLALLTYLKNPSIFGNGFGANLGNLFGQQQQPQVSYQIHLYLSANFNEFLPIPLQTADVFYERPQRVRQTILFLQLGLKIGLCGVRVLHLCSTNELKFIWHPPILMHKNTILETDAQNLQLKIYGRFTIFSPNT